MDQIRFRAMLYSTRLHAGRKIPISPLLYQKYAHLHQILKLVLFGKNLLLDFNLLDTGFISKNFSKAPIKLITM